MSDTGHKTLIALGSNEISNWGDAKETVQKAISELQIHLQGVCLQSALYQTPAFPAGSGPDYVNAAVSIETRIPAAETLDILHKVETAAGRIRTRRWAARTLDVDLIAQGAQILPDADTQAHWCELPVQDQMTRAPGELILPHPRLQDRAFVLIPLADVAPDWVHPRLNLSVVQMLARLPAEDRAAVIRLP